ncbi:MAG: carbamoyl-phosphate synthase small subunit [Dehalococcoidia bacterium]|nr:carbamoyl-phosphate synthase small subunit [Dehalococcoidia bacterium]
MAAAYLVLNDGTVYEGQAFGASTPATGEVVFNTSMTGYQEILTDPSYAGQIVMPTYPLIGNYGINSEDFESSRIQVSGFVVRQWCDLPSHTLSERTIHDFLASQGIPGISGVDTRAITRKIRTHGVMMGMLAVGMSPKEALAKLNSATPYDDTDFVKQVSTKQPYEWQKPTIAGPHYRVVVDDCGLKRNIARLLTARGCEVTVLPAVSSSDDILGLKPDGVVMSPGPGDPAKLDYAVNTAQGLIGRIPILGICLGQQVLARAMGGKTYKLKFGHRGGNHPVMDIRTGKVHITAQNHGYSVDADSLPRELEVSHINLNDGTVEGLRHRSLPLLSIQYHSEAAPGPRDNEYIFDEFVKMMRHVQKK